MEGKQVHGLQPAKNMVPCAQRSLNADTEEKQSDRETVCN
jgi:hypothetical protein